MDKPRFSELQAKALTLLSTTALKAIYTAELASDALREQLAAIGADGALRRTTLFAAPSALRVDLEAPDGAAMLSTVRRGANPLWALDHRRAPIARSSKPPRSTSPRSDRDRRPGHAVRSDAARRAAAARGAAAASSCWRESAIRPCATGGRLGLAGLLPRRYHDRLPVAIELVARPRRQAGGALVLRSLERVTMPITDFQPPSNYTLRQIEPGTHRAPAPARRPRRHAPARRESAIAALLGAFDDEVVKLQLRDELPERLRTAHQRFHRAHRRHLGRRPRDRSRRGVERADGADREHAARAGRRSPIGCSCARCSGTGASQLKRIFGNAALRQPFLDVITALEDADPGAPFIDPAPGTSTERSASLPAHPRPSRFRAAPAIRPICRRSAHPRRRRLHLPPRSRSMS